MTHLDTTLDRLPDSLTADEALALLARIANRDVGNANPAPPTPPASGGMDALQAELVAMIADTLHLAPDEVAHDRPLMELGLDSISATDLMGRFNETHDLSVPSTILFEFDTIEALAKHLWETHATALAPRHGATSPTQAPPCATAPTEPASGPAPAVAASQPAAVSAQAATPTTDAHESAHGAPRRVDVKTLWAEIEAGLGNSVATTGRAARTRDYPPDESAWARCAALLALRVPDAECLQLPDRRAAVALLQATAGRHPAPCLWIGPDMPEGATALDPLGETALEDLLRAGAERRFVCFAGGGAVADLPPHLMRAIEVLRSEGRCHLALFVAAGALPDAESCRVLRPDLLFAGEAPLVAAAIAPSYKSHCDQTALRRMAASYCNNWHTAALAAALGGASE